MTFSLSLIMAIIVGSLFSTLLLSCIGIRLFAILQQEGYCGKGFVKWCFKKDTLEERRLALLFLALALLTALFNLIFCFLGYRLANTISVIPYLGMYLLYFFSERKRALKVSLNPTPRVIRLSVCNTFLLLLISCGLGFACAAFGQWLDNKWAYLFRFVPFALLPLFLPLIIALSNLIMKCYEIPHAKKFVKRAMRTLGASNAVKVGITGSFGKTSVKNFAQAILSEKYRVIATPSSYNTPLGIARAVNEGGLDCDVFLAEMGARRTGDIKELCDMVSPAYGVVTGVCCQHLETFGSIENIRKEKCVLAERARYAVLGKTVEYQKEGALVEGVDFSAENVRLSENGIAFSLRLNGEELPVSAPIFGRHAAEDIALAAALCSLIGMTNAEIAAGLKNLKAVPHRLEKSEANGVTILDDSYNSNVEGAKNAVEALRCFGGGKFVVTPGLVELGTIEAEKNRLLGESLAGLDFVILVGETRVLPVREGYLKAGGAAEKLRVVPTLKAAQEVLAQELKTGDCVLFLNDLPDKY